MTIPRAFLFVCQPPLHGLWVAAVIFALLVTGCTPPANSGMQPTLYQIDWAHRKDTSALTAWLPENLDPEEVPILVFHADWCLPCKVFELSLDLDATQEAMENALILSVNIDNDPDGLTSEFEVRYLPTFIKLNRSGQPIARITSTEWGPDDPENVAAVMDKLVNTDYYDKRYTGAED